MTGLMGDKWWIIINMYDRICKNVICYLSF